MVTSKAKKDSTTKKTDKLKLGQVMREHQRPDTQGLHPLNRPDQRSDKNSLKKQIPVSQ